MNYPVLWIVCVLFSGLSAGLAQEAKTRSPVRLTSPLVVPEYPICGKAFYGADLSIQFTVEHGKVRQIEVIEAWLIFEGKRWAVDPSAAQVTPFLGALREAMDRWEFTSANASVHSLRAEFRAGPTRDLEGDYTVYRVERAWTGIPTKLVIEWYLMLNLARKD
jgi:hypothetical protein